MVDTDVLIVGAGPVGLTAAAELRRQGVACRVIDRLPARLPYAKAVGVQPRTLEIWDRMGMVRVALEVAVPMRGQVMYADGVEQARIELRLPPEVPYVFAALPQYETERIIEEHLARFGTGIERGTELVGFTQDEDGVVSRVVTASGAQQELRSRFLVGCDGAHSTVRKGLGLAFEGGAFPEEYMLADVEVDWSLPQGYGVRAMHHDGEGHVDDVLVCIPLPGDRRPVGERDHEQLMCWCREFAQPAGSGSGGVSVPRRYRRISTRSAGVASACRCQASAKATAVLRADVGKTVPEGGQVSGEGVGMLGGESGEAQTAGREAVEGGADLARSLQSAEDGGTGTVCVRPMCAPFLSHCQRHRVQGGA